MVKVAVTGAAGRMGRLIVKNVVEDEELQLAQAFDVVEVGRDVGELAGVGKVGVEIEDAKNLESKLDAGILIDFTNADAAVENIRVAADKKIKLVVGTTGFSEEQRKLIEEYCKKVPAVITPNFSIGVNVFWRLLEFAVNYLANYDIEIVEAHHRFKKDAPSGTALKAAEIIKNKLKEMGYDRKFVFCREGLSERKDEIGMFAVRGGDIVGEHTVYFIGFGERVEITHRATSRQAFASGAVKAAKWISKVDKPGLYRMNDVLGL
ncbi:4-hydroxy-tetrahydrodipicolinate reductase [Archaeoglobales archaeon]|nr:MAG: 4-hydroxy-tetrahydrodipicolinate reductase [Archaeoglobales archaeon]